MKRMFSNMYESMAKRRLAKILVAAASGGMATTAFAQATAGAWGGTAMCMIATNTKATIGIAAVIGIMIGGVMALFKKGDHLLDTVVSVCIVCGVAFLAVTIINQMGFTVNCSGL